MAERSTITARRYTPTVAEQVEQRRDRAISVLAFVVKVLNDGADTLTLNGAPLEGLACILDAVETDLCEASLQEKGL